MYFALLKMMNENKTLKRRFSAHKKGVILFKRAMTILFLISLSIGIVYSENRSIRTVNIKVAADGGFINNKMWKQDMERLITNSSQIFENYFGIKFLIEKFEYWQQKNSNCTKVELLNMLRRQVSHGKSDLVLGLVHEWCSNCKFSGIANYLNGYILLKKASSKELMKLILLHEISHIFGAIDLNEKGSIMDNKYPEFEIEKKDYDSAIEECNQALQLNPDSIEIHNFLGISFRGKGEIDRAISEYKKVLDLQPFLPEVHYNLGIAYEKKGMNGDAGREYQKAIRLNPQYANAYSNLGYAYIKKGLMKDAEIACSKAIALNPTLPEAYNHLAKVFFSQKKYDLSWDYLRKAETLGIRSSPDFKGEVLMIPAKNLRDNNI